MFALQHTSRLFNYRRRLSLSLNEGSESAMFSNKII